MSNILHSFKVTPSCSLSKILLYYVRMDIANVKDDLRDYLWKEGVNLAEIERETSLNRSWLSKFKRGEIKSPTIDQLVELDNYRKRQTTEGAKKKPYPPVNDKDTVAA